MRPLSVKVFVAVLFSVFVMTSVFAQKPPRKDEIVIKSTVECALCKKNVEASLGKVKGIRKVSADFSKKEITVAFNPRRISADEIKKKLAELGYDADDIKANNRMTQMLKHKAEKEQQQQQQQQGEEEKK